MQNIALINKFKEHYKLFRSLNKICLSVSIKVITSDKKNKLLLNVNFIAKALIKLNCVSEPYDIISFSSG